MTKTLWAHWISLRVVVAALLFSLCVVTMPAQEATGPIRVAAGTIVPLTLVNTLFSKSTPVGSTVRASVPVPVVSEGRLAIPVGTYVEGAVTAVIPPKHIGREVGFTIHFTRLIYANGYTASLDGVNVAAVAAPLVPFAFGQPAPVVARNEGGPSDAEFADGGDDGGQSFPTVTPPTSPGPNPVVIASAVFGFFALLIGAIYFLGRHEAKNPPDHAVFSPGLAFKMQLESDLTLDGGQVAAAAAARAN